ncbi:Casein kinase II subunit beta [Tritrichomonas foetus]|uniref:Casein kinase II subunit beta n=1 Tax=Tritrichomonas foetus TaxID=1144522 RepID=A0A1J4KYS7_9EUKA|nr:Casein kinase II subunit beta [Tritrichomonas foetus]|eukprot:OHT16032.1 Casein kinase II subunit beta [Tritrichomonas foetus]
MSRRDNFRALYFDPSSQNWLVEIDDMYLQSAVSYYGLNSIVPNYSRAAGIIKGRRVDTSEMSERQIKTLAESCRLLYGLLHQRYIVTEDGIRKLENKYRRKVYGVCPRVACKGRPLIPMGLTIEPRLGKVRRWCPQCHDIYDGGVDLDGAYFGSDLPIMFHKMNDIPIKFRPFSSFLKKYIDENGNEVPEIKQRLYRWGEYPAIK